MKPGYLKQEVEVCESDSDYIFSYGLSTISLPKTWVNHSKPFTTFMQRSAPLHAISLNNEEAGLFTLLINQGFINYIIGDTLTLKEAKQVFDSIRPHWYRQYYNHPLWNKLKEGSLNVNGLVAWLIHNYHVSRSAGMTDARFATRTKNKTLYNAYKESCLEEYSHCDEFYFVEHEALNLSDIDVRKYVHLPSSLAFDQQMLRMAEDCWLGHVFISYFQEATVNYYDDCKSFYAAVEENYGITNFFDRWKKHIELDLNYGHFGHFESIFSPDVIISKQELTTALKNAWFTFSFLYNALTEVEAEEKISETILLRNPIKDGKLHRDGSALLHSYADYTPHSLSAGSLLDIYRQVEQIGLCKPMAASGSIADDDISYVRTELRHLFFKALSYAETHEAIILFGNMAQAGEKTKLKRLDLPGTPQCMALINFIHENSYRSEDFAFLVYHLLRYNIHRNWVGLDENMLFQLEDYLSTVYFAWYDSDRLLTRLIQLNELYRNWMQAPSVDLSFI